MKPVVAIVGRPNVGKSTLFNRLLGERQAIIHNSPGVTRDRHYGESFWNDRNFMVIDTGGYVPDDADKISTAIREQVELAIDEAQVILFVVDTREGIHPLDESVIHLLRTQQKPFLIAANKADTHQISWEASEFYALGVDAVFPISAMSGSGTGELLDALVELLPEEKELEQEDENIPRLAIVGRPNAGKSSLVNALLNEERSIVTDIAGTTRDTINSEMVFDGKKYILLDTAGLRRRTKIKESIEFYSSLRTDKAIRECTVAILILDATRGLEAQDVRILAEIERFNKGIIIALNKWDLVEKETNTFKDFEDSLKAKIPTMSYVPVISISALTKQRISKLMILVDEVINERKKTISTSKLNEFVQQAIQNNPLPRAHNRPLKINYVTQAKTNPPVFIFFMNNPRELPSSYRRYLEGQLRKNYGFSGVPITMTFREKH